MDLISLQDRMFSTFRTPLESLNEIGVAVSKVKMIFAGVSHSTLLFLRIL